MAAEPRARATWGQLRTAPNPKYRCQTCTRRWPVPPVLSERSLSNRARGSKTTSGTWKSPRLIDSWLASRDDWIRTTPQFGEYLGRFQKNPLYRAIRASRFYTNTDGKVTLDAVAVENLKLLAQADLAQDTANPSMPLMTANVMLADAIPGLRIIMDHLPSFDPTPDGRAAYEAVIKEMAARPNIFVKLSQVYHPRLDTKQVVGDYMPLRERLEYLYGMFGEDRVIFGTDYPNSYGVATISEQVGLMKRFFSTKTRGQADKYFWRNAARVYKYVKRAADQPASG